MLMGQYYEGMELHRGDKILIVRFTSPHRTISTCRAEGGLTDDYDGMFNQQGCEPTNHMHGMQKTAVTDPAEYRRLACKQHGLGSEKWATLGTAANMNCAAVAVESFRDLMVVAACTGGVETNAGRVGDPASFWETETGSEKLEALQPPPHGTINTMICINKELTKGAMVRAVMTATEAKTAVLQELAVNSRYSDGLATGTGTDQIAIASKLNTGKPMTGAGKHSKLGELIGLAVKKAIKQTLLRQNGMNPEGQCSCRIHLQRFGATKESMLRGMAACLNQQEQQLLEDNFSCIDKDPVTAGAIMALVHIRDKYAWGLLPETCLPELMGGQAALAACSISGDFSRFTQYREELSPISKKMSSAEFLDLALKALGLGFRDKWTMKCQNTDNKERGGEKKSN
ncbi:protein of unknown function DUF105 [Desulfatibacillum aliphaticivorans]|uniref:Adenosylcobinamide amidohydrolase n=1 Tax=Desulfatibacillum aliphaticivorans TaxID=218208 RepID=B8FM14_DESAL|nr:adenosylcobinamide amidohydrolase [Desulfatibacillum aliphaticivorans]ACL05747.1 protein of unknown function DUF105 [Desulfatibacillum aliphaticivorans]